MPPFTGNYKLKKWIKLNIYGHLTVLIYSDIKHEGKNGGPIETHVL